VLQIAMARKFGTTMNRKRSECQILQAHNIVQWLGFFTSNVSMSFIV